VWGEDIDLTAATGNNTLNIQLENVYGEAEFDLRGTSLNTVNLWGDVTVEGEDDCGNPTVEPGWVDMNVYQGSGTKFTLNSSVNTELDIWADNFTEVDASASTGDIEVESNWEQLQRITTGSGNDYLNQTGFITTASKAAVYSTGAGDDYVNLWTDGAGSTTVNLGDGDDEIDVWNASKTLVINAGAGNDSLFFGEDFQTAGDDTTTLTVDMGDGDDEVIFSNLVMADLPATWQINGGAGNDLVSLWAGASRTFAAGDYVTLTESLTHFDELELWMDDGVQLSVDASRLSNYHRITFAGAGAQWGEDGEDWVATENSVTVTKVSASQTIAIDSLPWTTGEDFNLSVTANGYEATKANGGDLNIVAGGSGNWNWFDVTANGVNVTFTLEGNEGEVGQTYAQLYGDFKTAHVTLNSHVVTNDAECPEDLENIGIHEVQFWLNTGSNVSSNLTSLTLTGRGEAYVWNVEGDKLATVNASGLTGIDWSGATSAAINGFALYYETTNASTAETITLSRWYDGTDGADRWASSYAKMDTVTGLTLVGTTANPAVLDTAKSDLIWVDTSLVGGAEFAKLSTSLATTVSNAGSLGLALQAVAQSNVEFAVFHYGGNTYIFGDTGGLSGSDLVLDDNDQLDDTDLVIKITGTVNLDLLLQSLNG
jgi:trimeric autotransporter adhesin